MLRAKRASAVADKTSKIKKTGTNERLHESSSKSTTTTPQSTHKESERSREKKGMKSTPAKRVAGTPNAPSVVAAASVRKRAAHASKMRVGRNVDCALYTAYLLVAKKLVARAVERAKAARQPRVMPEHVLEAANDIL